MFSLKSFVMATLEKMAAGEPEYRVRQYALGWFQQDVLTEDDLAVVDSWFGEVNVNEPEEQDD